MNTVISVLLLLALWDISRSFDVWPKMSCERTFEKSFSFNFSPFYYSLFHDRRCLSVIFPSDDRQYLTCPVQNCKEINNFFPEPSLAFPFLSPSIASVSNDSTTLYASISSPYHHPFLILIYCFCIFPYFKGEVSFSSKEHTLLCSNESIYLYNFLYRNIPWAGTKLTIPPGLCVANTSPGPILPAAPGPFLKHLMDPLPFGHGPPWSVVTPSHSPQPTKTTRAGSKPLCKDSTRLSCTNILDTEKEGVFRRSIQLVQSWEIWSSESTKCHNRSG